MAVPTPSFVYGKHAVHEALERAPAAVTRVYFVDTPDDTLLSVVQQLGIPFDRVDAAHLPRGIELEAHQRIVAQVTPSKLLVRYRECIEGLEVTPETALVLLDELTDPHNVGAVIRSAAAFGVAGVLIPEHRQAPVTGTVVKVSAGMAFAVPLVSIGNVNTVLRDLKDRGFWIYGLVGDGDTNIQEEEFTKPSVFVLGNEGRGLREKTEELCDFRLSIPMSPQCESLNAAASAAVTFYAWRMQHSGK